MSRMTAQHRLSRHRVQPQHTPSVRQAVVPGDDPSSASVIKFSPVGGVDDHVVPQPSITESPRAGRACWCRVWSSADAGLSFSRDTDTPVRASGEAQERPARRPCVPRARTASAIRPRSPAARRSPGLTTVRSHGLADQLEGSSRDDRFGSTVYVVVEGSARIPLTSSSPGDTFGPTEAVTLLSKLCQKQTKHPSSKIEKGCLCWWAILGPNQ